MMHILHAYKKEKGQAMVEMAIVLPVLLLLLCAIIDFGWVNYCKLSLSYASREGARYGVVHADDPYAVDLITQRVLDAAPDFIKDKITVTVTFSNPTSPRLGDLTVRLDAYISGITPLAGTIFSGGSGTALSSQSTMKVE